MSKQERRVYEFGPYRLLPAERLLLREGEPVQLAPKAFETLVVLVERAGRLVEKEELLEEVWPGASVEESNIAQNIFTLRRKLGTRADGEQYIETVPKSGYRFLPGVRVSEENGGAAGAEADTAPVAYAPPAAGGRDTFEPPAALVPPTPSGLPAGSTRASTSARPSWRGPNAISSATVGLNSIASTFWNSSATSPRNRRRNAAPSSARASSGRPA